MKKQKIINVLDTLGLTWFIPVVRLVNREEPGTQIKEIFRMVGLPIIGLTLFALAWTTLSKNITTSVGFLPGPAQVWASAGSMLEHHNTEKYRRQEHAQKELKRKAKYEKAFR